MQVQGGIMSPEEIRTFEQEPHFKKAVKLRRFDEAGKAPDLTVPGFDHYKTRINKCLICPDKDY